jgi:hypothetical protein
MLLQRAFSTGSLGGNNMPLNDIERKRIENAVAAFIQKRRPPAHVRPRLDYGFRLAGQSVELFEVRPQFDRPEVKRESSFAKATFVHTKGVWRVYWMRSDLKWHSYEHRLEVSAIADFLAVVQKDEHACFFG